jgi:hypothetical protein
MVVDYITEDVEVVVEDIREMVSVVVEDITEVVRRFWRTLQSLYR